jgi:hypothetical protein
MTSKNFNEIMGLQRACWVCGRFSAVALAGGSGAALWSTEAAALPASP